MSGTAAPIIATSAPLAQGSAWNLRFEYPANWTHYDAGYAKSPLASGGYSPQPASVALGTLGQVEESQTGPGETWVTTWDLGRDSVAMTFEWEGAVPGRSEWAPGSLVGAAWSSPPTGSHAVSVAGLPALFARSDSDLVPMGSTALAGQTRVPNADEVLVWKLTSHFDLWHDYSITAAIRGPDVAGLEAQVQAVVDSIRYADPVTVLVDTPAGREAGLASFFDDLATMSSGRDTSCFPREPGATATATITGIEVTGWTLEQPLQVRCSAQIEAMPEQAWKVTLTYAWDATGGYPSGSATDVEVYLPGYGSAGNDTGFEKMPYAVAPQGGNG